jgi:hypothetical protein
VATSVGMNFILSFPKQIRFVDEVTEMLEAGKETKTNTHEHITTN